jgi:hypothetical protein
MILRTMPAVTILCRTDKGHEPGKKGIPWSPQVVPENEKGGEIKLRLSLRRNSLFGPKRDEVTGGWRKLDIEELRDL